MGGEKLTAHGFCQLVPGSPPRGRGKARSEGGTNDQQRITPAWAGKSGAIRVMNETTRDHPRVGGEKPRNVFSSFAMIGSPPRGRGKGLECRLALFQSGITPAWAGKSVVVGVVPEIERDHPRVGGEKYFFSRTSTCTKGSPPRGRGKEFWVKACFADNRITPAWAGKRLKRSHRSGIFISGPIPFHSVLHRPAGSGGSRAGRDGSPAGQPQNAGPA